MGGGACATLGLVGQASPTRMPDATKMATTVIIPSYRRGAKIVPTLTSLQAQTSRAEEIVVVNDGGFEETVAAVRSVEPQVRVLDVPHGGAARARNFGVRHAKGDLVVLLDDDDTVRPDALATLEEALRVFPAASAAFGDMSFTSQVTGEHSPSHFEQPRTRARLARIRPLATQGVFTLYGRELYDELLHGNLLGQPWLVRRDVYEQVGGFASGLGSADDWELYLRLTKRHQVVVVRQVISDHFHELGRVHLTTDEGQTVKQAAALTKHLSELSRTELLPRWVLRRRLAGYWKHWGDAATDRRRGWLCYLRSAALWPFDGVVLARLALWAPSAVTRRGQDIERQQDGAGPMS